MAKIHSWKYRIGDDDSKDWKVCLTFTGHRQVIEILKFLSLSYLMCVMDCGRGFYGIYLASAFWGLGMLVYVESLAQFLVYLQIYVSYYC